VSSRKGFNVTKRENALIAYHHGVPSFIPSSFTDISIIQARPQMERYCGVDVGLDEFGVEWTFVPQARAPMPTTGKFLFEDISDWRKHVKFPDLEAIDWEKQANIDVHTDFMALVAGAGVSYVAFPITIGFDFVGPFLEEHFRYGMGFYANQQQG
jgi:hypothetical protein